jgi:hypothetical protein
MIINEEQLRIAQTAVHNLQQILLEARKAHNPTEYKMMAEPILLEIQQRQQEILDYFTRIETEAVA